MDILEKVTLDGLEKFIYIISLMSSEEVKQLRLMLLKNMDVFAWSHSNMVGINPTVASHKLNMVEECWGNVSKIGNEGILIVVRQNNGGLYRRHAREIQRALRPHQTSIRGL